MLAIHFTNIMTTLFIAHGDLMFFEGNVLNLLPAHLLFFFLIQYKKYTVQPELPLINETPGGMQGTLYKPNGVGGRGYK